LLRPPRFPLGETRQANSLSNPVSGLKSLLFFASGTDVKINVETGLIEKKL
jgi:hypothetical protein